MGEKRLFIYTVDGERYQMRIHYSDNPTSVYGDLKSQLHDANTTSWLDFTDEDGNVERYIRLSQIAQIALDTEDAL